MFVSLMKKHVKKASDFNAKTSFPQGLQVWVFHKCHVFHLFSSDRVNDCIGLLLLVPMAISQGDGHVGSVHAAKVVVGQVPGGNIL
jgi:hypothetical protein